MGIGLTRFKLFFSSSIFFISTTSHENFLSVLLPNLHAVPGFMANKAFSVLLQPVYNKYPVIVSTGQGKSNELFGEIKKVKQQSLTANKREKTLIQVEPRKG